MVWQRVRTSMVDQFDEIVLQVEENAETHVQPNVLEVRQADPHIYLVLDNPVQCSRPEFLQSLSNGIAQTGNSVTLKFLDAENEEINGVTGIRYRLRVDEVDENPF